MPVDANTTYVASYYAPVGRYAVNNNYFAAAATTNGPLTALRNGTDGGNGVYKYGATGFPNSTYQSSNYWVDVVFDTTANDTTAPTVVRQDAGRRARAGGGQHAGHRDLLRERSPSSISMALAGPVERWCRDHRRYDAGSQTATLTPNAAAGLLHDVHGDGQRRAGRGGQHDGAGQLVLHHRCTAAATTGPGSGRPDRAW